MDSADIIIIGGGAAGMMAAAGTASMAAKDNNGTGKQENAAGTPEAGKRCKVVILEKMPRPGRKIMISGKGRCNFTNLKDWNEFSPHIHPAPNLLKPAFMNLTSAGMIEFLERNGLETVVERGDRAFPASHLSSDVVDTLVSAVRKSGAELLCNKEVCSISAPEDDADYKKGFQVKCTDGSMYSSRLLIVATGGLSYPSTGSTGDGLTWAAESGIAVSPCFPSLTAIVPRNYKITQKGLKAAAGQAEKGTEMKGHIDRSTPLSETGSLLKGCNLKNVSLSIFIDDNLAQEEAGDMDFTDGGIEGPIGFKVSRKCVKAMINGSKVEAAIDLKPAVDLKELDTRIQGLWKSILQDRRSQGRPYSTKFRVLLGKLLPAELVDGFLRGNPDTDHAKLARRLKNWRMPIDGYVGYERCVVTAGGISADEVKAKTLESKKIAGLYFAGEILDLDADTGGYNLQTAFSTGFLAGQSAARYLSQC